MGRSRRYIETCNDEENYSVKRNKGNFTQHIRRRDHAAHDSDDSVTVQRPNNPIENNRKHDSDKKRKNVEDEASSSSDSELENLTWSRKGKKKVCENGNSDSEKSRPAKRGHKKKGIHAILDISSSDDSSSSDDLLKLRKCETSESTGVVKKNVSYYRSNIKTAVKELGSIVFRESHITAIKRTPFWLFFKAILASNNKKSASMCRKHEEDIRSIIKTFDKNRRGFLIGGEFMVLNKQDVQLIFGVCDGHIPIEKNTEPEIPPWLSRHFGEELKRRSEKSFTMGKAAILQKLKRIIPNEDETSVDDVARLTHCYLLAGVLALNQSTSMRWELCRYLENLDDVCLYDWSTMIVATLLNQITMSKNMKAGGCTMLLPYWLCERSGILEPIKRDAFPRFLKWDLTMLHQTLIHIHLTKPNSKYENILKLKPTKHEKKTFRELIEWQDKGGSKESANEDDKENTSKLLSRESGTSLAEPNQPSSQLIDAVATKELFTHAEELIGTINSLLAIGSDVDNPSTSRETWTGIVHGEELACETTAGEQNDDAPVGNHWNGDTIGVHPDMGADKGSLDDVAKAVNEENTNLTKELTICKTLVTKKEAEISKLSSEIAEIVKQKMMEKDKYEEDLARLTVDKEDLELKFKDLESEYKRLILQLREFANQEEAKLSCIVDLPRSKESVRS